MRVLGYGEFAKLPEGVIYSYHFPEVSERDGKATQRDKLAHTEGLYVKGTTFNTDPQKFILTGYNFTQASLLPKVDEDAEQFERDPDLQHLWEKDSAHIDEVEGPGLGFIPFPTK